jgi:hypothetical protein
MARYNKIYAGPVTQTLPQVQELPADAATLPGCLIVMTNGEFALAGASTVGKVFIAQDNYLAMKGTDDAYDAGDVCIGMELLDEQFFNARVATGNNVTRGAALTPAANGLLALASTSDMVVAFAEEAYNNTSGESQLVRVRVAKGYLTAAA